MGEQIASIRRFAGEAMVADAMGSANEKRDQRAAAAEELQINRCIDAQAAGAPDDAKKINNQREESRSAQRDDIFRGNLAADVEDRTILLKDQEVNILRAEPVDGAADGRIRQDGRL